MGRETDHEVPMTGFGGTSGPGTFRRFAEKGTDETLKFDCRKLAPRQSPQSRSSAASASSGLLPPQSRSNSADASNEPSPPQWRSNAASASSGLPLAFAKPPPPAPTRPPPLPPPDPDEEEWWKCETEDFVTPRAFHQEERTDHVIHHMVYSGMMNEDERLQRPIDYRYDGFQEDY